MSIAEALGVRVGVLLFLAERDMSKGTPWSGTRSKRASGTLVQGDRGPRSEVAALDDPDNEPDTKNHDDGDNKWRPVAPLSSTEGCLPTQRRFRRLHACRVRF